MTTDYERAITHTPDQERRLHLHSLLERFRAILADVSCSPYGFIVGETGGSLFLQVAAELPCNATGVMETQKGRKWLLSQWMTESEVVQTALMAVLAFEEHETRERFTWKGRAIYDGHYSADQLWELRGTKGWSDYRPKPAAPAPAPKCGACGVEIAPGEIMCEGCAPFTEI
jgi:hypothetical protein